MNPEQADTNPTVRVKDQADQPQNHAMHNGKSMSPPVKDQQSETRVIWSPRFIVWFALTMALGLSIESLLTQGWAIRWYAGTWIFLVHLGLLSAGWIVLLRVSRSRWFRLGAIFGLIFAAFVTINVVIQAILVQPSNYLLAHVNVVTSLALAGCSICLTISYLPAGRWDAWLLGLSPILGLILVAALYVLRGDRSMAGLENSVSLAAIILSILTWWMRPTCWRNAPAPTFLFGFVPFIFLALDLIYVSSNSFVFFPVYEALNATATLSSRETVFFFSQVILLCLLLGVMRLIKSEIRSNQDDTASLH